MNTKRMLLGGVMAVAMIAVSILQTGCAGCEQKWSHTKSKYIGLNRQVTFYANDGTIIKSWHTRTQIEDNGGSFRFMVDGKAIQLAGTVLIEEE